MSASDAAGEALEFARCARLPADEDNVAIATRRLESGQVVRGDGRRADRELVLSHTVLEGHRFVSRPVAAGERLTSWGLPFGTARRDLAPGEYLCNARMLAALRGRSIVLDLPEAPNFDDHLEALTLSRETFRAGAQVERVPDPGTFQGFARGGGRGVGTRNHVVVLGLTADAAPFAEAVAARFEGRELEDPVVAVAHTEGGGAHRPNNLEFVLRTLAGFLVHPNVGAVLLVDAGSPAYGAEELLRFAARDAAGAARLAAARHATLRLEGGFDACLARARTQVEAWLAEMDGERRTAAPLSELKLALQCGGSDAFSGVSGNALAGWVARELIRHGGAACLAETDELIGAEPYVLSNVRDYETAARFLERIEVFKQRVGWHGATAEGNPSGGNNFRGLYNIALKSIGAGRKKHPDVRLDGVLEYGERLPAGGYYFMDSPGNDLESLAGQIATGANLILFITGNGSITNFPFVPTLKFVTTTARFELLANEMDVNAGRYNDGESMDAVGADTFERTLRVASGERSKGERAGHSQVSLWRDWRQSDGALVERLGGDASAGEPAAGTPPLAVRPEAPVEVELELHRTAAGTAADLVGLVVPTSLCSGQVARGIARTLNEREARPGDVSRFVALVHTEGCGSVNAEHLYLRTLRGYLRHPLTRRALLLEHGCEKTHNDAVQAALGEHGVDLGALGLASVQMDGGIERVTVRARDWFDGTLAADGAAPRVPAAPGALRLGLLAEGPLEDAAAGELARLAAAWIAAGATVVVPEEGALASATFRTAVLAAGERWRATLAYGQPLAEGPDAPGLHVLQVPTTDATELLTGLAATGVEVLLAHVGSRPLPAHPLVPLLQVTSDASTATRHEGDLDAAFDGPGWGDAASRLVADVASGRLRPRLVERGVTGFQMTRGLLGISL